MQVPNTIPLDLQMQLLGPDHVKAQIPMIEASEISQYPDFLKSLSTHLSPVEMCNLLTQDRKPILQVLLDHDALETSVVQNWMNTPADLLIWISAARWKALSSIAKRPSSSFARPD